METLQEFRKDESWGHLYHYAKSVASLHGIDIETSKRKKVPPRRLEDMVIMETTGSREVALCGQQYKIELYFPVLDTFVAEMDRRFTSQNIEVMKAIRSCSPESDHF